jgi:hypothetical protein
MKPKHKTIGLFAAAAAMITVAALVPKKPPVEIEKPQPIVVAPDDEAPVIQVALLLDTSSSMDGLIDQARSELWRITRQLSEGKRDGRAPRLEVALYEYGNDRLPSAEGYMRQVLGFTTEIDRVSEALFALTTDGGSEFAGLAIRNAAVALPWSKDDGALKMIFIAGNEGFAQGPISPAKAMDLAKSKGIVVNPIFCGDLRAGIAEGWKHAAMLAGGEFMAIDHNQAVAQIAAPQDGELVRLNTALNGTYIPYGGEGEAGMQRQLAQDSNSNTFGLSNLSVRSAYKASAAYQNPSWELVDGMDQGRIDVAKLDDAHLPEDMRGLDADGRRAYVAKKKKERSEIQKRIRELTAERDTFVANERAKLSQNDSLDVALLKAVTNQAKAKGFDFE